MRMTVGTDIVGIRRFQEFTHDINHPTLRKIFTQAELDYCFSKDAVEPHLAARFAGKEATIKALYSRNIQDVWYTDIEISNKQNGVPVVELKKEMNKDLRFEISLAHCEDKAIAFVVILGDD
ncbi:MAG TPA: holo-ACP synthase [Bacillota bacterium]|jgi:holo-[acyl-carrier protein] synthase|nr:holo-ACP synthase [Bacillota bacterium]